MEVLSDEAVLACMATGDGDATAVLVRRFQARVYGLARTIVGDGPLAEDVAQEAFVRAWRSAMSFDPRRGGVAGWLLTITRNLAIDQVRARRQRPTDSIDPHLHALLADDPAPEVQAVQSVQVRAALAALGSLPPGQRRAVLLATYGGRTAAEVGEMEQIPVGTAKTRIRSGLLALRERFTSPEETQP